MAVSVREVWRGAALLGEGPIWHAEQGGLYWVDIKGHRLHRMTHDQVRSWSTRLSLSCVALGQDGSLVGALGHGLGRLDLSGDIIGQQELGELPRTAAHMRFNDGKVAPDGTLWIGLMDDREIDDHGCFWRFSQGSAPICIDEGYMVPNGPAFDPTSERVFLTDSGRRTIFKSESRSPRCLYRKPLRSFEFEEGCPDGMTIDNRGHLWVAYWDGGCIRSLDPVSGQTLRQIDLPCRRPTSCAFGGPNLDVLFVTSARFGLESPLPEDGSLFSVHGLGVRGLHEPKFGSIGAGTAKKT